MARILRKIASTPCRDFVGHSAPIFGPKVGQFWAMIVPMNRSFGCSPGTGFRSCGTWVSNDWSKLKQKLGHDCPELSLEPVMCLVQDWYKVWFKILVWMRVTVLAGFRPNTDKTERSCFKAKREAWRWKYALQGESLQGRARPARPARPLEPGVCRSDPKGQYPERRRRDIHTTRHGLKWNSLSE